MAKPSTKLRAKTDRTTKSRLRRALAEGYRRRADEDRRLAVEWDQRNPQKTAVITVSLPLPMVRQIDRQRKADNCSRSELVRKALRFYLRAQPNTDAAGRQAYLNAKAGKGLSPAYDTADDFIDALHQAVQRPTAARRRTKK
ncbi:MAG: ribbon-helix-helix domain-containing protein [Candidatus Binatia bacterium]